MSKSAPEGIAPSQGASHEWDPPSPSLRRDKLYATNETYVTRSAERDLGGRQSTSS